MHEKNIDQIKLLASRLLPEIIAVRRELHQHPELSFEEVNTSARIKDFLDHKGIDYTEGWAKHGVVASIKGSQPGPIGMLRADIDALPIFEENDVPYRSVNPGVMHACGHDVHTSAMLGVASILQQLKDQLKGEIKLIFQPGEEKLPGGASQLIKEGLFRPHRPDYIIGQHVFPSLPAGHVGFHEGLYMASADELYITIIGKGGHAATPHLCIDPILIGSRVVIGLQELISRNVDPMKSAVLTIGQMFTKGGATNIIPDKIQIAGTLRAMDETWRYQAHQWIKDFVHYTCKASGASAEITIEIGYPSLKNDELVTRACREAAIEFLGPDKVHEVPQRMSSEDFAFYTQEVPGTFYRVGTGSMDESKNYPVHSNKFDIDESSLETGMGLMAYIALNSLA